MYRIDVGFRKRAAPHCHTAPRKELYGVSDEEAVRQIVEEYEDVWEP